MSTAITYLWQQYRSIGQKEKSKEEDELLGFLQRLIQISIAFGLEKGFFGTIYFLLGAWETQEQVRRAVPTGQRHPQRHPHTLRAGRLLPVHPLLDHQQRANQTVPQRYRQRHRKGRCHPVCWHESSLMQKRWEEICLGLPELVLWW